MAAEEGRVYAGIGGWTYAPWRGVFYPKGLAHAKELTYAASHLTSIEVNGTFYRAMKPSVFRKWASETPEDFVFALKGPRYAVGRRVLAEAGDSIKRFLDSGITELGGRLGPLLWQFAPTKKFDEADFGKFLELLPASHDGVRLRHTVEVRHSSFCTRPFITLLRKFSIPVVYAEHEKYPAIADLTGDFVYARLQKGKDSINTGYAPKALDQWTKHAETWAKGGSPSGFSTIEKAKSPKVPRDVFIYFIHEGKKRAPAAAMALIERLQK